MYRQRKIRGCLVAVQALISVSTFYLAFTFMGMTVGTLAECNNAFGTGLGVAEAAEETNQPDIQWFRDQMQISPKYQKESRGVMGMSWAHFLTMVFMGIFFIGAVLAYFVKSRRTKQILASLLKEEEDESSS